MLRLQSICKKYRTTEVETTALDNVSIEIAAGEFLAVMGPSGCGKSTLLNILGLMDSPQSGAYWFFGEEISKHGEGKLAALRKKIGFIFQGFNLIDDLNVVENVEVSLLYNGTSRSERKRRAMTALERVGIAHRAKHSPQQLSGGQQQRVAIARALVKGPQLILADEPTGNLDTENGAAVMNMLSDINSEGTTIVMVTHSVSHADHAKRAIKLLDGRIVAQTLLAA